MKTLLYSYMPLLLLLALEYAPEPVILNYSGNVNPQPSIGQSQPFRILIEGLCCDKTTEQGADEVYLIITGRSSNGKEYSDRSPSPTTHWDMNDNSSLPVNNPNGDSHCIGDKLLFSGNLQQGETWWFNVLIAEEDGGSSGAVQTAAGEFLIGTEHPVTVTAGAILIALAKAGIDVEDTDDWMGDFGIAISYDGSGLRAEWNQKEGIISTSNMTSQRVTFKMTHDGSDYTASIVLAP